MRIFSERFETAFHHLIEREGYYANLKGDQGGETYCGVARTFWPNLVLWHLVDAHKLALDRPLRWNERIDCPIVEAKVKAFYQVNFWNKIKADKITSECVALLLFDSYVHSGSRAIEWIQQAANEVGAIHLSVDRQFGPRTLAAVNACDAPRLFVTLKALRAAYLGWLADNVAGQSKFKKGWLRRINGFTYAA